MFICVLGLTYRLFRVHSASLSRQDLRPVLVRCCSKFNLQLVEEVSSVGTTDTFKMSERFYLWIRGHSDTVKIGKNSVFSIKDTFSDDGECVSFFSAGYGSAVLLIEVQASDQHLREALIKALKENVAATRVIGR
jgi:hypothetical protein